jgi:hypothetical protein
MAGEFLNRPRWRTTHSPDVNRTYVASDVRPLPSIVRAVLLA